MRSKEGGSGKRQTKEWDEGQMSEMKGWVGGMRQKMG